MRGLPGPKGERGPQGERGVGQKGDTGTNGGRGEKGEHGAKGVPGERGQAGEPGVNAVGGGGLDLFKEMVQMGVIPTFQQIADASSRAGALVLKAADESHKRSNESVAIRAMSGAYGDFQPTKVPALYQLTIYVPCIITYIYIN